MNLTDRMIAPGATRGEVTIGFSSAFGGAALAFGLAVHADYSFIAILVITLVAFDMFGGAVVNATGAAKLWYHRRGRTSAHHLGFVAIHVQPFLLAWAVPDFTWLAASIIYCLALVGALVVTAAPPLLRRPIAFGATAFAIVCATSMLTIPHALAWFAPVLLIKLLLAHLLPEEAAR